MPCGHWSRGLIQHLVFNARMGLMWALYLSFVNVGQTFYAFGWESILLETGSMLARSHLPQLLL